MNCTVCRSKECRSEAKDCFGIKESSLDIYDDPEVKHTALAASLLIDNGRAGTLNRLEEITEYCKEKSYRRIGVAYCFGMPDIAASIERELQKNGFETVMVQCTAGGVKEKEIDPSKTKETVSCNPAGQALALKQQGAEFVIEAGLCMGHDVIFHKTLELPFTVFAVKDRIYRHQPVRALDAYRPPENDFLESMDESFRMKSPEWVSEILSQKNGILIDVRSEESYAQEHIKGALSMPLKSLPRLIRSFREDRRKHIIIYCTGGIQAAYAVMYFQMHGWKNTWILSGGFSRWKKENRPSEPAFAHGEMVLSGP